MYSHSLPRDADCGCADDYCSHGGCCYCKDDMPECDCDDTGHTGDTCDDPGKFGDIYIILHHYHRYQ